MADIEDAGEIFDAAARMRELAAEQATGLEQRVRLAEERRDELLGLQEASPEQQSHLDEMLNGLLSTARAQLAFSAKQATLAGELLAVVNPEEPEHVGIVTAEADAADTLSRSLRALAAVMRLIDETRRHVKGRE
jgi:PHD/YefM family antitoxin component YafN of YafNO toxin-antitoxin module